MLLHLRRTKRYAKVARPVERERTDRQRSGRDAEAGIARLNGRSGRTGDDDRIVDRTQPPSVPDDKLTVPELSAPALVSSSLPLTMFVFPK